jgi:hypothetical protein
MKREHYILSNGETLPPQFENLPAAEPELTMGHAEPMPRHQFIEPPILKWTAPDRPDAREYETYLRILEAEFAAKRIDYEHPEADFLRCVRMTHKAVEAWERGRR